MREAMFLLQSSRHYKKFEGVDFSIVRNPMYTYSKQAKEKLLRNKYYALLYIYYLFSTNKLPSSNEED